MHTVRRQLNRELGKKVSGRQWRKYRKEKGIILMKVLRRNRGKHMGYYPYGNRKREET